MDNVQVEAESIIKLEVKEEPIDNVEESLWNKIELEESSMLGVTVKEEHDVEEEDRKPQLSMIFEANEDALKIKQEEEELEPPAAVFLKMEDTEETKAEGEDPLASCCEDISNDSSMQEGSSCSSVGGELHPDVGDTPLAKSPPEKSGESSSEEDSGKAMAVVANGARGTPHWGRWSREQVVTLYEAGGCSAAAAGRRFGISAATARNWIKRWRQSGEFTRRVGTGLSRVSTSAEDDLLVSEARSRPLICAQQLKQRIAFPGTSRTILRRLSDAGLRGWGSERKHKLVDEQRVDRLAFAEENARRDWGDVVFSGACVFSSADDGPERVFRSPHLNQHNRGYVAEPRAAGRASVACWGWLSARGVGVLHRLDRGPLAAQYVHVLENIMLPSVRMLHPDGRFYLQQDQCRVHKSESVQDWFASQTQVELLHWPPCSADLNPVEDVWEETKEIMSANWPSPKPKTCDDLWELVSDAWDEVASSEDYAAELVRSLPRRLSHVLENDGHSTYF